MQEGTRPASIEITFPDTERKIDGKEVSYGRDECQDPDGKDQEL